MTLIPFSTMSPSASMNGPEFLARSTTFTVVASKALASFGPSLSRNGCKAGNASVENFEIAASAGPRNGLPNSVTNCVNDA